MRYIIAIKKKNAGQWMIIKKVSNRARCREFIKVFGTADVDVKATDSKKDKIIYITI